MRRKDLYSVEDPEPEVIAAVGGARLIWIPGKHKRLEIRGGTEEEQRLAWEWAERFLPVAHLLAYLADQVLTSLQYRTREDRVGHGRFEHEINKLASSQLHSPLSALHPNPGPCFPRAQASIGVGASRPHAVPLDSNHSKTPSPEKSADSNAVPPVAPPPTSEAQTFAPSPTAPTISPSNTLQYPQIPSNQSAEIFPPDSPATGPSSVDQTHDTKSLKQNHLAGFTRLHRLLALL